MLTIELLFVLCTNDGEHKSLEGVKRLKAQRRIDKSIQKTNKPEWTWLEELSFRNIF